MVRQGGLQLLLQRVELTVPVMGEGGGCEGEGGRVRGEDGANVNTRNMQGSCDNTVRCNHHGNKLARM